MKQLVVLVGLPGSGKTAFHSKKSDWVVVSKDVIRRSIFGHSYEPRYEEAVDRIFATTVVEAVQSPADVVCIDDLNLLRKERRAYVELGQMSGRHAVAVVLPYDPIDELYEGVQAQLQQLASDAPGVTISPFPRERFEAMSRCYEAVHPDEGFAQIVREEALPATPNRERAIVRRERTRREERQHPIPLFAA